MKGFVVPQTRVNEIPYMVRVCIFKNTGTIHKAHCHCIAGLSGICKHVAGLLYRLSDTVKAGLNKPDTCHQQVCHHPSNKLTKSAFIADIATSKATSMRAENKTRRADFDPRPVEFQRKRTLGCLDLDGLAEISNGEAAVLM